MIPPPPRSRSRALRNILLAAVALATALCFYNVLIIYPSFTGLLLQYTKNDAVRASHYLSATLKSPSLPTNVDDPLAPALVSTLHQVERSMELIGLKLYSPSGLTLYSTNKADIGLVNDSEYFQDLTRQPHDQARFINRDSYSLEGVQLKADVVEAYAPLLLADGRFGGAVEIYYDISKRKALMDRLVIHSTMVLSTLIAGMVLIVVLLFLREKKIIRERLIARQVIDESRETLRTILDSIPDRIFLTSEKGEAVWCNGSAELMLGQHFPPEQPERPPAISVLALLPEALHASYHDNQPREAEISLVNTQSVVSHFLVSITPVVLGNRREPHSFLLVFRDITEKKNLQEETVRAGQLAAIGELAAGVAHEINNPINGIINCAQILLDRPELPAPVPDIAGRIAGASDRIAMIVRSLLSFARSDTGNREKVSIAALLNDTLDLTEVQLQKDHILLHVDVATDLPPVTVHRNQLQQVLLNLISNSRYAVRQRFPKTGGEILLKAEAADSIGAPGLIRLLCADNGPGFPEEIRQQALNPFFTTKPVGEGTGLGLSISQSIIKQHGGTLHITASDLWPTVVIVTLPINQEISHDPAH